MSGNDAAALADALVPIALEAGRATLKYFGHQIEAGRKADGSPVTKADVAAQAQIIPALAALTPDIPIIAEESAVEGDLADGVPSGRFWLVDPLDGTKEFLRGSDEFTVNIALIEDGAPVLGCVHRPVAGMTYWGDGQIAYMMVPTGARTVITVREPPEDGLVVVGSKSHADPEAMAAYLDGRPVKAQRAIGSSLKFVLVAMGEADLYPRFGTTMEWDTAAGDAVLRSAGGEVTTLDGTALTYGKPTFRNPHFIARGGLPEPVG